MRQSTKQQLVWERSIDDIFCLWDTNKEYIQLFIEKSNSYHPTIKFTDEVSENEITFLDTTVYNGVRFENESILNVRSHFKPTETVNSCHPPGVKKGFFKGEALTLLRTNSSRVTFTDNIKTFKTYLISRGYPKKLVEKILSEGNYADRKTVLTRKQNAQKASTLCDAILTIITMFGKHTNGQMVFNTRTTKTQRDIQESFKEPPLISYRKGKSLKDMLVKGKL